MQDSLFHGAEPDEPAGRLATPRRSRARVAPAPIDDEHRLLRAALPARLRLGTSSWNFTGWAGLVWDQRYPEATLSRHGLGAYAQHPLLRTVSLDRVFYRPLSSSEYAAYANVVPDDFRFVVKAPSRITDAMIRGDGGRALHPNTTFLDPDLAVQAFAVPALEGLRHRLGALNFQISPLPSELLARPDALIERFASMLRALPELRAIAPEAVVSIELRDPALLTPAFAQMLRDVGATYCLGLHAKMPPIDEQLPMLRALWPGPLVCRWNLNRLHGAYGYAQAEQRYGDFDRLIDPDPDTRSALARVIVGTTGAGFPAYVTIDNKAEGSAPLSVIALATEIARQRT